MARDLGPRIFDPWYHDYLHDVYNGCPSELLVFNTKTEVYNIKDTATIDEDSVVLRVSAEIPYSKRERLYDFAGWGVWAAKNSVRIESLVLLVSH